MFFVYVDFTACGIPFYVGKGLISRIKKLSRGRENSKHENIANKYGQIRHIILATGSERLAFEFERQFIADLHTFAKDPLAGRFACNFTIGGEGTSGAVPSEETRHKRRLSMLGKNKGKVLSEEHRKKLSIAHTGKKHSEKWCAKMREIMKGRKLSDEWRAKISKGHLGIRQSQESIEKIRAAKIGKKHSLETREKMKAAHAKRKINKI
ncbi:MAG: hypothetical protein KGL39_18090 [Patescibacteria group bacterium]|nr:hypothetical protein [Patescibacteria group bacterium]